MRQFETPCAMTLGPGEADDLRELERHRYLWTGWKPRHWPASVLLPGLLIYGFDTRTRLRCVVCGFDFERAYGMLGSDFIEMHHEAPVSTYGVRRTITPEQLRPACANCHRMVHREHPLTGKSKWEIGFKSPNWSGTLVTTGGLVFTGLLTGEFIAVDVDTGKILWQFQTPSGIIGQPVTWERNGKQYVTVTSGIGGIYVMRTPDPNLTHVPPGGSLWTFKLFEE